MRCVFLLAHLFRSGHWASFETEILRVFTGPVFKGILEIKMPTIP